MKRRTLLGAVASILAAGAGCAPDTGTTPADPFALGGTGATSSGGANAGGGSSGGVNAGGSSTGGRSSGGTGGGGTGTGGVSSGTGGSGAGSTPGTGGGAPVFDAGTDPNRNKVQAGNVCDRLATIQCAGEAYCCTSPGRTFDQCKTAQSDGCASVYLDDITLNPVAGYDAAKAEAAFTEFERLASLCDPGVAAWASQTSGLRGIVAGTLNAGANCTPPSIINQAEAAGYLAGCTNPDTTACSGPVTAIWTCAARAGAGSACFTDVNCLDGIYCDKPSLFQNGTCRARKAIGTACGGANECLSLMCKGGVCVVADQQAAYCLQ